MHYDTALRDHGLPHDPFKALVVPRPIGWVSTIGRDGVANLAPYSFFNAVSDRPPMLVFSSGGTKDSLRNILDTGEFTCSIATWALREPMNLSSATVARGVDEFALAGLTKAASRFVAPPRVAESPAAFECKLWQTLALPAPRRGEGYTLVIGSVVGVYIDEAFIVDGIVQSGAMRPLARLGYMDYSVLSPESVFTMNRPRASADGLTAVVPPGAWDGVYR
ncbi:MAG TPA: flavin reductase family protein [Rubrivivax sp.]|nr:flavin reductase family protein [Rubrivivax sp.]